MFNPNFPRAVGADSENLPANFINRPQQPTDPTALFQAILSTLQVIQEALAPRGLMQKVAFSNIPAGTALPPTLLQKPYNAFLVTMNSGTLNVSFGGGGAGNLATTIPDMAFNTTLNPLLIPFPMRNDPQLQFWVDVNSPAPATGSIYVMCY